MPIFVILLVLVVVVLAIYFIQKFVQDPAKTILIIGVALLAVVYFFKLFGLWDVRI